MEYHLLHAIDILGRRLHPGSRVMEQNKGLFILGKDMY